MKKSKFITEGEFNERVVFTLHNHKGSKTMPKTKFPPSVLVPTEDTIVGIEVVDGRNKDYYTMPEWEQIPEVKKSKWSFHQVNLHIRYLQGEQSIFVNQQTIPEDIAKKRKKPIIMYDGGLIVRKGEITKLKYLNACNYNASNTHRSPYASPIFSRFDLESASEKANVKILKEVQALAKIGSMGGGELEVFALAIGEDIKRFRAIAGQDTETLRREMLLKVKKKPDLVDQILEHSDYAMRALVAKGFAENIWLHDEQTDAVLWAKNQKVITRLGPGTPMIDHLVELIKKDERWERHYDQLKEELNWDPVARRADKEIREARRRDEKEGKKTHKEQISEKFGAYGLLVVEAIENGALIPTTKNNLLISWISLVDDGDHPRKWHGMKKMVEAIQQEEGLLKLINEKSNAIAVG